MFTLTVVTPEKKVLKDAEVEELIVPGSCGELNLLPGHSPLMATIKAGILKYRLKGESKFQKAALSWGYCQVNPKGINILADTCEVPEEIDADRAKKALDKSNSRLQQAGLSPMEYMKFQRKVDRAQVRIQLLEEK